jgi:hypothetical protein
MSAIVTNKGTENGNPAMTTYVYQHKGVNHVGWVDWTLLRKFDKEYQKKELATILNRQIQFFRIIKG